MPKSTRKRQSAKAANKLPLFRHATGRWAKKCRGKLIYLGKIDGDEDGQEALEKWLREKDYHLAGQKPPAEGESRLTVRELVNAFLTSRQRLVDRGDRTVVDR